MTAVIFFFILFIALNWDWIIQLRQENLSFFTDDLFSEMGYRILVVTIPLMMIQNVVTAFPIIIIILIHFLIFGLAGGFLFSLIGTTLGALLCFWMARTFSHSWMERFWEKNLDRLAYVMNLISSYGVFIIIVLRSIPVMPSNIISAAAALSPIRFKPYIWSSLIGNISMIWVLSLLASPLWMEGNEMPGYAAGYLVFALAVAGFYGVKFYKKRLPVINRKLKK